MMKNFKENQEQVAQRLEEIKVAADAGAGAIRVEANGKCEILNIAIDPDKIDLQDHDSLEDLLLVAVNRAIHLALEAQEKETRKSLDSMLPGGLSGLFG